MIARGSWKRAILFNIVLACLAIHVVADDQAHSTSDLDADICSPLLEAQTLLTALQPSPNAHLIDKVGSLALDTRSWGRGMGWTDEGPLSTTLRLIPRFLRTLSALHNTVIRSISETMRIPGLERRQSSWKGDKSGSGKISRARREKIERMWSLITEAEERGCSAATSMRAKLRMFPPRGVKQDLPAAFASYSKLLESVPSPEAQFFVGFFHATGLGGVETDQGKATLYYTFSALQGYRPAEMALGYRYWAGIGVKEDCLTALDWYEAAAEKAYSQYQAGPSGGRSLPLTPARLSDLAGGIYGQHASWASTGAMALRASIRATSASARGETEKEVLEYYQYHSDRDSLVYTVRLGRLFYFGSVYFMPGGVASGAEAVGEIPQDYRKAKEYFMKAARHLWPQDFDSEGKVMPRRKLSKEQDDAIRDPAVIAAGFLGRMATRGEGGKEDYKRAKLWLDRAAEMGDREAHNGLGILYRDGLLVPIDKQKAYQYFGAAAGQDLAEAQVHLAKLHIERGERLQAVQYLEAAIRHGSPFEAFHLLSRLHARTARTQSATVTPGSGGGMCGVSVAWYKLVAEKGDWSDPYLREADRAYLRGEEKKALLGWWIAAEMGYEAGQNNVAYYLSKNAGAGRALEGRSEESEVVSKASGWKEKEVGLWVRSAAQDNVDAMVKVGDYFYQGVGVNPEAKYEKAAGYYQTAADTQSSSMAYWNLAWMYQNGEGVPRDWHLAKRYYDLASETSHEANLAVAVSLIGLYLKSCWVEFKTRGEIPRLALFDETDDDHRTISAWERIKSLFSVPDWENDGVGEAGGVGEEGADDYGGSGSGWTGGEDDDNLGGLGGGLDEAEDLLETLMILGLFGLLGVLAWVRGRYLANNGQMQGVPAAMAMPGQAPIPMTPNEQAWQRVQDAERVANEMERRAVEAERERAELEAIGMPVGWEPPLP